MTKHRLRFGILGTGNIANQFAEGVSSSERCVVTAVGSRRAETAQAFATKFGLARAHGSYNALINDNEIEALYLSLPNSMHHEWTIRALEAGKHVLCEKPIATSPAEAEAMFDTARRCGRVLIEAFMYRAHPQTHAVLHEIGRGTIGQPRLIRTSFCYRTRKIEGNVRFSPELAGGALMDIGCYCIDFARLITGQEPSTIQCTGKMHATGVDESACGTLGYADGTAVSFCCGMAVQTDNAALICGEEGYLRVPVPWKPPLGGAGYEVHAMTPPRQDGAVNAGPGKRVVEVPFGGALYGLEADAFASAVLDGGPPFMPEADSLSNMRVLEALRRQIGL